MPMTGATTGVAAAGSTGVGAGRATGVTTGVLARELPAARACSRKTARAGSSGVSGRRGLEGPATGAVDGPATKGGSTSMGSTLTDSTRIGAGGAGGQYDSNTMWEAMDVFLIRWPVWPAI